MPVDSEAAINAQRLAELAALVDAVKERVRSQYPEGSADGATGAICVGLPDLAPLARARDAATGKMAAIGTVNPRSGGLVNNAIQAVKRSIARALNWLVRDQVVFNRQMIACVETCIETLADVNRTIHTLAGQTNAQFQKVRAEAEPLRAEAVVLRAKTSELQDVASHWARWREEWQLKLHKNEVGFLKSVADLNTSMQQKVMYIESATQQRSASVERRVDDLNSAQDARWREMHASFQKIATELDASYARTARELEAACQQTAAGIESRFMAAVVPLEASFEHRASEVERNVTVSLESQRAAFDQRVTTSINELQQSFYADLERIRTEYERVIHAELRVVRQRMFANPAPQPVPAPPDPVATVQAAPAVSFDYARFADRFRGPQAYVTESQRFYLPFFSGCRHVLDIGCGRGEFLSLLREAGVPGKGIEASDESVAYCCSLGLDAVNADLFGYLADQPEATLDGIFCSQVVEHLPPHRLPEMIRLCATRLSTGGILAIETPDPECLAIFATHFYLDPTHTRPVPSQLLAFYMEECGLGRIEVHRRAPAVESMPEVASLPEPFRQKFFGGLDYAILARKL